MPRNIISSFGCPFNGQVLLKLPKYSEILTLECCKTFEGWNLRRFVRIQYICLCTNGGAEYCDKLNNDELSDDDKPIVDRK